MFHKPDPKLLSCILDGLRYPALQFNHRRLLSHYVSLLNSEQCHQNMELTSSLLSEFEFSNGLPNSRFALFPLIFK